MSKVESIKQTVRQIIVTYFQVGDPRKRNRERPVNAMLAFLRRGVGKSPGDLPELFGFFLQEMPEELSGGKGDGGTPTAAEWAIYLALTLYAVHQQSRNPQKDPMHKHEVRFGSAVRDLAKKRKEKPEESGILSRFNALMTAKSMPERANHLRAIVQQLRAHGVALDYGLLAKDLYDFQFPASEARVRLRWGRDYYSQKNDPDLPIKEPEA